MKKILLYVLLVLAAVVGMFISSTVASAAQVTSASDGVTVTEARAHSSAKVSTSVRHVGTYVAVAKSKLKHSGRKGCFWARGTWTNTTNSSGIVRYTETSRAKFCPLKRPMRVNGVTYRHVKVAGGLTGSPCYNPAIPPRRPQPKPQLSGFVLDVKSLTNVRIAVKVNANAKATVSAQKVCADGAVLSGSASGTASANSHMRVKISSRSLIRSKGKINGTIRAEIRYKISATLKARARADALARITFRCGSGPGPNPDVNRPPVGEVDASAAHMQVPGRRVELWFHATDPDGDSIALDILASLPSGAYISGKRQTSTGWDGRPCPASYTCWSATMWSGNATGDAIIRGRFSAAGQEFTTAPVVVKVERDQFPVD